MRPVKKVLLIDDEPEWTKDLSELLSDFEVTCATDKDCLKLLRSKRFDYVVIDLKMPKVSGKDAYIAARRENRLCGFAVWTLLEANSPMREWFEKREVQIFSKRDAVGSAKRLAEAIGKLRLKEPKDLSALVADDTPGNLEDYVRSLRKCGIRKVQAVESIKLAKKALKDNERPDIVLLDTYFGDGDKPEGAKLARRLLESRFRRKSFLILFTAKKKQDALKAFKRRLNFIPVSIRTDDPSEDLEAAIREATRKGPFCE